MKDRVELDMALILGFRLVNARASGSKLADEARGLPALLIGAKVGNKVT